MGWKLVTSEGRVFWLKGLMTMGRSSSAQIVVRDVPASRMHAELWADRDAVVVRDSGSTNGTYVNGKRISASSRLQKGDRLTIGDTDLVLEWESELESAGQGGRAALFGGALQVGPFSKPWLSKHHRHGEAPVAGPEAPPDPPLPPCPSELPPDGESAAWGGESHSG